MAVVTEEGAPGRHCHAQASCTVKRPAVRKAMCFLFMPRRLPARVLAEILDADELLVESEETGLPLPSCSFHD